MEDIQLSPSSKRSGDGCQIMACGDDEYACLGLPLADDDEDRSSISPTLINPLPNLLSVRAMAAGEAHSVALMTNGVPYSWGFSQHNVLGRELHHEQHGTNETPGPVIGFILEKGDHDDGKISHVAAGAKHTLYLSSDGRLYASGTFVDSAVHTFSIASPPHYVMSIDLPPITKIYSSGNFCAAMDADGMVWTWGECALEFALERSRMQD
jgi:alpha-tubulin suppressor-like RCC1 family protein